MTITEKITLAVEILKPLKLTEKQIEAALGLLKEKSTPQGAKAGRKVGASAGSRKAKDEALRKLYEIKPIS